MIPSDPRPRRRFKRSVWMPILLLIYLLGMTIVYAPTLIADGEIVRLVITIVSELFIIVLLHIFLRKQEKQREQQD